jgi:hypothetical protein
MNDLERLALQQIRELSRKAQDMLTQTAVKAHGGKESINPEKEIYPASSVMSEIDRWAEAIVDNQRTKK